MHADAKGKTGQIMAMKILGIYLKFVEINQ
ncbi:MAG: hypothetical protein ACI8RY_001259 [Urechidicola sp.]|jgi:hypothetical protein